MRNEKKEIVLSEFMDYVRKECIKNDGGLVLQMIDGILDIANPSHLEWVDRLGEFPVRYISKSEAQSLGFDELSDWSHDNDQLIFSEMGVLFNLGSAISPQSIDN